MVYLFKITLGVRVSRALPFPHESVLITSVLCNGGVPPWVRHQVLRHQYAAH